MVELVSCDNTRRMIAASDGDSSGGCGRVVMSGVADY